MPSADQLNQLDHTPLTFGKYRGQTPNDIAEKDPSYICWMYETVENKDTCSELLYRECKGAKPQKYKPAPEPTRNPETHIDPHFDRYDDMDDDIPF